MLPVTGRVGGKKINSTGLRLTPLDVRSRLVAVLRPFALRREFYGLRLENMANQSLGNVSGPALLKNYIPVLGLFLILLSCLRWRWLCVAT